MGHISHLMGHGVCFEIEYVTLHSYYFTGTVQIPRSLKNDTKLKGFYKLIVGLSLEQRN